GPQEAALRMLMNNLDPDVAERPDDLIVYGGSGKAARNWPAFDAIVRCLTSLEHDETLLVQSGKPVGILRTHPGAPRVLIANALLVPAWATWDNFRDLEDRGLTMFGQMTAGSWIYIGSQGIVQGTYETLAAVARSHFGGSLGGRRPARLRAERPGARRGVRPPPSPARCLHRAIDGGHGRSCTRDADPPRARRRHLRLRQQHPGAGARRRRRQRL